MKLLLFLFGAALAAGLYFVLADLLKIPRLATERALISAGRKERSLVKSMETLILGWSLKLAPLIRLDVYKRRRLETKLTAAGLDTMTCKWRYSPERSGSHFWIFSVSMERSSNSLTVPKSIFSKISAGG